MAVVNTSGSRIMTGLASSPPVLADPGEGGGRVHKWCETIETSAADSMTSTYHVARLPSSARVFGSSVISHDALGATTATLGVGLYNTSSRSDFTNSTTALNTGIVASTAGTKDLIADRANWGKRLWEYTAATSDPRCDMDVKILIESATAHLSSGAGTITVEIDYATD
jgi:hypothetical protein